MDLARAAPLLVLAACVAHAPRAAPGREPALAARALCVSEQDTWAGVEGLLRAGDRRPPLPYRSECLADVDPARDVVVYLAGHRPAPTRWYVRGTALVGETIQVLPRSWPECPGPLGRDSSAPPRYRVQLLAVRVHGVDHLELVSRVVFHTSVQDQRADAEGLQARRCEPVFAAQP